MTDRRTGGLMAKKFSSKNDHGNGPKDRGAYLNCVICRAVLPACVASSRIQSSGTETKVDNARFCSICGRITISELARAIGIYDCGRCYDSRHIDVASYFPQLRTFRAKGNFIFEILHLLNSSNLFSNNGLRLKLKGGKCGNDKYI